MHAKPWSACSLWPHGSNYSMHQVKRGPTNWECTGVKPPPTRCNPFIHSMAPGLQSMHGIWQQQVQWTNGAHSNPAAAK